MNLVGDRELTGAVDLISHFKLLPHHDFFCKRSLPISISDTHYLHNVIGDTEIRKGEGMQLDQLIQSTSFSRDTNARIQPFDLDVLREAFQLRETSPIELPPVMILILEFILLWLFFYMFLQLDDLPGLQLCGAGFWVSCSEVVCYSLRCLSYSMPFIFSSGREGDSYHCWEIEKWVQRQGEEA